MYYIDIIIDNNDSVIDNYKSDVVSIIGGNNVRVKKIIILSLMILI